MFHDFTFGENEKSHYNVKVSCCQKLLKRKKSVCIHGLKFKYTKFLCHSRIQLINFYASDCGLSCFTFGTFQYFFPHFACIIEPCYNDTEIYKQIINKRKI